MKSHARVVVVGGGVMGCSLLYHLTRLGWRDVVLLEKNELTAGSTWHAAGLCTHYAHNLTIMKLRTRSVEMYRSQLKQDTGQDVSFHACGALRITRFADRMDEFRQVQGIGKLAGLDFHLLDPQQLKDIYPPVDLRGIIGAIYEPLDGHVDPSQATHAMAKGARQRGAEIYRHNEVLGIQKKVNGEWLVSTRNGDITAEHIVNAAGTWCREIGSMMGLDLPVVPMLHQYIVTDSIDEFAAMETELPMIRDPDESWYLRMERDGVIIGPYEKNGKSWAIDGVPADFGMDLLEPDLDAIAEIATLAMTRVPSSAHGGIKKIVHGPITFTPDANPLIGPAYDLDNAWVLTGSSMGVMEGGGAGEFLAQWMESGSPPMDAVALDSRRFGGYADKSFRVEKATECFAAQFGIHYPYEERSAGRMKKVTPAYELLKQRGAVFGSVYGFERANWYSRDPAVTHSSLSFKRPNWFDSVAAECRNVRGNVALADLSAMSKFLVSGPDALLFMDQLGANSSPLPGRINLNHVLTATAGIYSEFSVSNLDHNRFYLVSAAAALRQDEDLLRQRSRGYDIQISDVTDRNGVLSIMGPNAEQLLSGICEHDLSLQNFPALRVKTIEIGGIPVLALRLSFVGESGWELHHAIEHQVDLFRRLMQAGEKFDLDLCGAFAINSLRLEKGYPAWGADLTTERSVIEAGLDRFVKTGTRKFIGRKAISDPDSCDWQLQLLALDESEFDPFYLHGVYCNDKVVGIITSAAFGHTIGKSVALAYLRKDYLCCESLAVSLLGQRIAARLNGL